MSMFEQDDHSGASYLRISQAPVVRTVHVGDMILVDVDESGEPVGIEFAMGASHLTPDEAAALIQAFPQAEGPVRRTLGPQASGGYSGAAIVVSSVDRVRIDPLRQPAQVMLADVGSGRVG